MKEKYYVIMQAYQDGQIIFIEASSVEEAKMRAAKIEKRMEYGTMEIVPRHWIIEMKQALNSIEL